MASTTEIRDQLTAPGGPFETETATVDGVEMQVYKQRMGSLRDIPAAAGLRGDDQPFIVYGDRRIGFTEFVQTANSVSAGLAEQAGVGHGDRVAVLSANNPEWCLAFWGTVDLGAILVGLNGWWKTDEILYGVEDSGAKVLVADRNRFARIAEDIDAIESLEAVYLIDADPSEFGSSAKLHRFDELTSNPRPDLPDTPIDEDDPAVILYTSGTTGRPKGAISTHRNMVASLFSTLYAGLAGAMAITDADSSPAAGDQTVSLFTSPLFHVSGCHSTLVVGLLAGLRLVMIEGRFEPEKALQLIQDEQVTVWATVPTMIWRLCEHPARHDYDTSTVRSVAFGGSPSADELQRKVRDTFPNVSGGGSNVYGLTESSSGVTINLAADAEAKPHSVGMAMPVAEIRILGADGTEQPTFSPGEVCIRGPQIMPGYWNKPEATAESIIDGWLHTGDIGHLDDEGYLFITDRAKDMIIRGGENVYCVEIENRLVEHSDIADAAVIGVPHPELGEEVRAVVQVEPGQSLTEAQVQEWVAETLAGFKVPTYVEISGEKLPRNASGKLLKNVLRGEGPVSFEETM
jgi:long-chain acyl-CoA synthetase